MTEDDRRWQEVIERIAPGATLSSAAAIQGGLSAEMTLLNLTQPNGVSRRIVVRRPGAAVLQREPNAASNQFATLRAARAMGFPTPTPLALETSADLLGSPYLVLDFIAGEPDLDPIDLDAFCAQLAAQLAAIHSADRSQADLSHLPSHPNACPERERPTSSPNPDLDPQSEAGLRATLQLDWRANAVNQAVLLHGDYWPSNVLWHDGQVAAVIDWEDAALGDPLADLANARLELRWSFGDHAMQAFTDHYRSHMPIDYANLPYWDLCAALHLYRHAADWETWAASLAPREINAATIRRDLNDFVEHALAEIAARGADAKR